MQLFLKYILIAATFALLVTTYLHPITAITQDLGRHIKTGEIIWQTKTVPKTNLYSYTYPDFPFINHHWGSEVIFYFVYTLSGFTGTLFITFLCSVGAFILVYLFALKRGNILGVSIVSFLSLGMLLERVDVRPESFSFLFFALFVTVLFKNREKPTKWLYALIPLQLLWANMHIYWISGLIVIGLFFLDALASFSQRLRFSKHSATPFKQHVLPLCILLIFSTMVTILNPNGLSGALYPFRVFENYGYSIEENQTVFFLWEYAQKTTIIFFWVSVIGFFLTLLLRGKNTRPIDWLLGITFTLLAIHIIRNFPLFVFALFIPFSYHLSTLLSPLTKKQTAYIVSISCCLLVILGQIQYVANNQPIGFSVPTSGLEAVEFMKTNNIKGPIFNNFDIGSYLIFTLYPDEKVFVDGRPESYPASFFQKTYIPMQEDPALFEKMDKTYNFTTVFFAHTDQTPWAQSFLQAIVKNPKWRIVFLNDKIIILTKTASHPHVPTLSLASFTPASETVQGYYQFLLFFQKIQDYPNMLKTAQNILEIDPTNCVALSILSQSENGNVYMSRYQTLCR